MTRMRMMGLMAPLLLLAACGDENAKSAKQAEQSRPTPSVVVAKAEAQDVRSADNFNGRVVAVDDVELLARVQGFLDKRLFEEGANVQTGDLLFVIDKRPFEAQVAQKEAELASAKAAAFNAQLQLTRGRELLKTDNIPKSEVDKREATSLMANAQVQQAEATLEEAKINLGYTEIRAPFDGRIGRSNVSPGALVGPQAGPLASIVRGNPIYVDFPVSQRALLDFHRKAAEQGRSKDVIVRLSLADGSLYPQPGNVDFLDIRANPGTDTVIVRAVFPNPDKTLVPGQFAGVVVESAQPVSSITVPQSALQVDQAGPFVLVVDSQNKVEVRRVETGQPLEGKVVVQSGLRNGDTIVVQGIQKVRPGEEVQVSEMPSGGRGAQP